VKPTHYSAIGSDKQDVTAWQFNHSAPIPIWVAKKFHRVGGSGWSAIAVDGSLVEAKDGDWVIAPNVGMCFVLTDKEFQECFKPL